MTGAAFVPSEGDGIFFSAIASETNIATIITNPRLEDNPIIFANKAFLQLTGYTAEETVGRNCRFLQCAETDPDAVSQIRSAINDARTIEIDLQNRKKNGELFWNRLMLSPVRDRAGDVAYYFGAQIDVTDRYAAQVEISTTAALLQTLVETAPGLLYAKDCDGRVLMANRPVLELFGRPWTEVEGLTDFDLLSNKAEARAIMVNDRAVITSGQKQEVEEEVTDAGERTKTWLSTKTPMRNAEGQITGLVGLSIDITERKSIEAKLRQLNETLEFQVAERTRALVEAEARQRQGQKIEAIGQLTGGIAHDFNNLLQAIGGSLEMMSRRVERGEFEQTARFISLAKDAVSRAAALTNRLLAFGRRQALVPTAVDPDQMLDGFADLIRRTVGPHIVVALDKHDGVWKVLCDQNQLESALLNVAINARDAMPDGGLLTIRTQDIRLSEEDLAGFDDAKPGGYVAIVVSDTGTGMTPEVVAQAFDPFFTTKPLGQGTGLGLSQLYGFVRQSSGAVVLESEIDRGTTVRIFLPRHVGNSTPETLSPERQSSLVAGGTVLVVDDEPVVRMMMVDAIEALGCKVFEAADGVEGVRLLQELETLDLLVTDVGLPGLNGRQLADAARSRFSSLPVVLVTGYLGEARDGWNLPSGMEVLGKPFVLDDLSSRVAAALSLDGADRPPASASDDGTTLVASPPAPANSPAD
jgi:PAS domain S-box-containing protein